MAELVAEASNQSALRCGSAAAVVRHQIPWLPSKEKDISKLEAHRMPSSE